LQASHNKKRLTILAPGHNKLSLEGAKEFSLIVGETAIRSDETGAVDPSVWAAFQSSGLASAAFSPTHGGLGLGDPQDQQALCTVLRMIGGADLSIARLIEGHVNAIMLISRYGTERQITSLAESVKAGNFSGVGSRGCQGRAT
jgi:alkylation response protein AidB-like acyl-CoA dehydrogenase